MSAGRCTHHNEVNWGSLARGGSRNFGRGVRIFWKVNSGSVNVKGGPTSLGCMAGGLGDAWGPKKPTDFRWLDINLELFVGCLFILCQVCFTVKFCNGNFCFSFFWGKGNGFRTPLIHLDPLLHFGYLCLFWVTTPETFNWRASYATGSDDCPSVAWVMIGPIRDHEIWYYKLELPWNGQFWVDFIKTWHSCTPNCFPLTCWRYFSPAGPCQKAQCGLIKRME